MPICAPEKVDDPVKSPFYWDLVPIYFNEDNRERLPIKKDKCQNRPTNPKNFVGQLSAAETADNPFALI
jgi:hypothetical protein